jgi:hypothetical protein
VGKEKERSHPNSRKMISEAVGLALDLASAPMSLGAVASWVFATSCSSHDVGLLRSTLASPQRKSPSRVNTRHWKGLLDVEGL